MPGVALGVPVLLREVTGVKDQRLLIGLFLVLFVIGALWLVLHVFVYGPVTVEADSAEVRFRQGRRIIHTWRRSDTAFTGQVIREITNGIKSGTKRNLIAITATGPVEVHCTWFSRSTFDALMADVATPEMPVVDSSTTD